MGVRGTRWQSESINCYFKQTHSPERGQYLDRSFFISFTREKKEKRKEKLFTSSFPHRLRVSSATHYPPLVRDTQTLSLLFFFFFFTRSPLFRDIGLTLAPASTTSKPEAEDPPRHPAATPVIRSSIAHPSPSTIVISWATMFFNSKIENCYLSGKKTRPFSQFQHQFESIDRSIIQFSNFHSIFLKINY